ncbi:MAG: alpha/beta fold hydrolase [Elusimicrobia bacterium]|nr:alpha/beta fold hydrolase [Candidatus Obscuribacterium magneticum]
MLAYERVGSGIPLVFLHPFPLNRKIWAVNRPAFSQHFQFITVDLPGFGESSGQGNIATMEMMAREVVQTLEGIGIKEKFVAAGMSMGGYVLFPLWRQVPDRLRGLILISTRAEADSVAARDKRFKNVDIIGREGLKPLADQMIPILFGKTMPAKDPVLIEQVRSWIMGGNVDGVKAALRGMAERPDSTPTLPTISVPTLVIAGEEDAAALAKDMFSWAQRIPRVEFQVVPQAGHLLSLEQPAVFENLVTTFLKRRVL